METKPDSERIDVFLKRTDFMVKLRAELENIEQGNAFYVFEGLQTRGFCGVMISFDGEKAFILPVDARPALQVETKIRQKAPVEVLAGAAETPRRTDMEIEPPTPGAAHAKTPEKRKVKPK